MNASVRKIISGGQTGVDRAALDVAIYLGLEHGGWCPKGRIAEDGVIPKVYQLTEIESYEYSDRTERNVIDSDGTLILFCKEMSGGTLFTNRMAVKHRRPCLAIDLSSSHHMHESQSWLSESGIGVLNVAGPRASSAPEIIPLAEAFLLRLLET